MRTRVVSALIVFLGWCEQPANGIPYLVHAVTAVLRLFWFLIGWRIGGWNIRKDVVDPRSRGCVFLSVLFIIAGWQDGERTCQLTCVRADGAEGSLGIEDQRQDTATGKPGGIEHVLSVSGSQAHAPLDVPVIWQEKRLCGAASLAMVFKYWGRASSQYTIAAGIGRRPGQGLRGEDLRDFSEQAGFSAFMFQGELDGVKGHLRKGRPVIVAIRTKLARLYHYIVLVGFDDASSVVLANDPQEGKLVRISNGKFLKLWGRSRAWSLLIVPK